MCKMSKQDCKVFIGGLSWETTGEKLRAYFENYGTVREAFVSYNRNNGRPRGFGFVVFESPEVADKVVAAKHTIDRREVEAKKAVPKDEQQVSRPPSSGSGTSQKTRKIFVGGLAPSVDEKVLRQYFEQFGTVEDAVVMYDHDNKRPRGFGFVTFLAEDSVDKVFGRGAMQTIMDKQIEIKAAVPRDQMPPAPRGVPGAFYGHQPQQVPRGGFPNPRGGPGYPYQMAPNFRQYPGPRGVFPGLQGGMGPGGTGPPPGGPRARQFAQNAQNALGANLVASFPQQRGGGGNMAGYGAQNSNPGKLAGVPGAGYDLYAAGGNLPNGSNNMFGPNSQFYGLAGNFPQQLNGMQNPAAVNNKLAGTFGNNLNLKALGALASSFGAFPGGQPETYQDESAYTGHEADFSGAEAAQLNLNGGLAVGTDFNSFHDSGFASTPAPGWSS